MDQKTIKEYIRALEHMIAFLRTMLDEELKMPERPETDRDSLTEFTELRMLAKSDAWPLAVPEDMICGDNEDQKLARAAGITNDFLKTNLTEKSFLDFGCGEGHIAYIAASLLSRKTVFGYDILNQNWDHFEKIENLHFTTNMEDVKQNGPFDIILLNDVLDHCKNPREVLEQIRQLKSQTGRIYLRCHPWTSRSGTHTYKELNKAFLHLVFTETELQNVMGIKETPALKFVDPLNAYRSLIKDSGFSIASENIIKQPVELFFTTKPSILRRIQECFSKNNFTEKFPREAMEIQFVDFILV